MFFQGLHRRNVWFSKIFMCLVLFFASKLMAGIPQKNGRSEISIFFLRKTSGSWGSSAQQLLEQGKSGNGVALRKKNRCNCRIGMIQLNPIWSSPIETLSSFQCTVTNEMLLHAEINNVLMTHPVSNFAAWHLPSTVELQTALCKEGNEQRRDKCLYKSQMSKGWVPINVEP